MRTAVQLHVAFSAAAVRRFDAHSRRQPAVVTASSRECAERLNPFQHSEEFVIVFEELIEPRELLSARIGDDCDIEYVDLVVESAE